MKEHAYECRDLVVGATLESLMLAYFLDAVYIQNDQRAPFLFDYTASSLKLEALGIENCVAPLYTNRGILEVGRSKYDIWEDLMFKMSIAGQVPLSGTPVKLRLKDNMLRVVVKEALYLDFRYEKLFLCDDKQIFGMPPPLSESTSYLVYDWFDVNEGCVHKYDRFTTDDALAVTIDFYASPRIDGNDGSRKDLVATSVLDSREKLFQMEYSDLYSRIKTTKLMYAQGIRGDNGTPPKITLNKRDVREVRTPQYEFEEENIKYIGLSLDKILEGSFDW